MREIAADLAGTAALLEIVENLGASDLLDSGDPFTPADLAAAAGLSDARARNLLDALLASELVETARTGDRPSDGVDKVQGCADIHNRRYESGYLTWSFAANRPYVDDAATLLRDGESAEDSSVERDGRKVAVSSRWIGSVGFYPAAVSEIVSRQPGRVVDLGAGAAGLLLRVLRELPESSTAVALDISAAACAAGESAARAAGLQKRLDVVHRPIQSIVEDPAPVAAADVVHAGFVMHDLIATPDVLAAVVRGCRDAMAPGGRLVVTDAVRYSPTPSERRFSALFTYLHGAFMNVELYDERQWLDVFRGAGFRDVTVTKHRMPAARMFVATK